MSAPVKKRATDDPDIADENSDDENDHTESDENGDQGVLMSNEKIQVEFEARTPVDSDFHGIKSLLQQLFLKANINLSEMTDTILSQNYIGSVVKQIDITEDDDMDSDDDDTVFGLSSVINLTERHELEFVKQLKSTLYDKCSEVAPEHADQFQQMMNNPGKQVGFLISERFINLPPQLAVPMYDSLRKEMDRATSKKMKYKFDWFLILSKTYKANIKKKKGKGDAAQLLYTNQEEEFLHKYAVIAFDYSVAHERDGVVEDGWDADEDMEPLRTVMLIPGDKLNPFIQEITTEIPQI